MTTVNDFEDRKRIWHAMSDLFLDTDVKLFYENIIKTCAKSKYSIDELKTILYSEVAPACAFNLCDLAGEWAGFDEKWLEQKIMKHKNTKLSFTSSCFLRIQLHWHWRRLSKEITKRRKDSPTPA